MKLLSAVCLLFIAGFAHAGAVISDGKIKLGVDEFGQLIVPSTVADVSGISAVGMRYIAETGAEYESTSHGCACEGWGVGIGDTGQFGMANNNFPITGLSSVGFSSSSTSATSIVAMGSELQVSHHFALSKESDNLYQVTVSIENTSANDIADLRYRRTFDWDASPTPFSELVSISGTGDATNIIAATNNGFCQSNPFESCDGDVNGDFDAYGPFDQGANFDFGFGELQAGHTTTFDIFFGAAQGIEASLAALGKVGAEAYSLGWSGGDTDQNGFLDRNGKLAPTFMVAFSGVGGTPLSNPNGPDPQPVNAPATTAIMILALVGIIRKRILSAT